MEQGFLCTLICNEWKKSHEARSLDRLRECALILCCKTSSLSRKDTAVWVKKLSKGFYIFVIDEFNAVCVKVVVFHMSII